MSFYPHYMEATFKTTVKKVTDADGDRYVPNLPNLQFGLVLVFCGGVNYYVYPLPPETLGLNCLCHVVYHTEDHAVISAWPGKLGKGNEVCKTTGYKSVVTQTVGAQKIAEEKARLTAEAEAKGEVVKQEDLDKVKYVAADKDDSVPVWIFQTKDYVDK